VLRDEQVVGQRLDELVALELLAAVVSLGRVGQHLDDDQRVEQRVQLRVLELLFAAGDDHVRVSVVVRAPHLHAHVARVDVAGAVAQLPFQQEDDVRDDAVMSAARARHREDLAREVIALELGTPLAGF
jgi:hypothetical protein